MAKPVRFMTLEKAKPLTFTPVLEQNGKFLEDDV
jgi:hypothetical protein